MALSRKLRVAVAGTSFAGAVQLPVFGSHPGTEVVAVSSGRKERAEAVAAEHHIPSAYTDFEQMLDEAKPDIFSIATPPDLHCPMALAAIERGIHVLCEKPFAMDADEAKAMHDSASKAGIVAMVDFEFRYLPARTFLRRLLRQKYVGKIRMVDFMIHFGWRSRSDDVAWNWWSDRARGGGVLGALGSHAVDSMRLWMGQPKRVVCDLTTFVDEREGKAVTSDDSYIMMLEFESGARAVVQMSAVAGVEAAHIGIFGSEGQLVIPDYRGSSIIGGKRSTREVRSLEIPERYQLAKESGHFLTAPFRVLLNSMVTAIEQDLPSPSPNFADGLAAQIVLDAARLSSIEGRWVEL